MLCHRNVRSILILLAALAVAAGAAHAEPAGDAMGTLVTTEWLHEHLDDPDLVILDCSVTMVPDSTSVMGFSSVSGRAAYEASHIPVAGFADLMGDLADTSSAFAYALPTPERFCEVMGELGVGDGSRVVLYDGLNSVWAARVWWMLRWVGFDNAALLDGGMGAWKAEERPLSAECTCRMPGELTLNLRPELIADRDEVLAAIDDESVVLIDVMPPPHYAGQMVMYDRPGHIPTAVFADLKGELVDADSALDFAIPSPEQFAQAMGALGVGDDSRVVLYDATGMSWAARVWWMLRWIGFDNAALLDGGLNAWTAAGGELSTEAASNPARELTVNLRPQLIADQDEVRASIEDDAIALIDVLPAPHYRGEWAMYDRPGHIRGATNVPVFSLYDESGHFRSPEELAALFEVDRSTRTIAYCGGGIAASSNAFVLTRLGFTDVAIYGASLQEWAADPENPMDIVLEFDAGAEEADK